MPFSKYSGKQKALARVAKPRTKITGADFAKLRKKKKNGKKSKKSKSKSSKSKSIPTNKALYAKVKAEAKRKFDVYPSAYANAWLVRTYKKRGGGYRTGKA